MKKGTNSKDESPIGVRITGDGMYPLVPLHAITIRERPEEGRESEQLFFNPRDYDSFSADEMGKLRRSIARDGLHSPPMVRVFTKDGTPDGPIDKIELIAGERRLRSCQALYETNEDVLDRSVRGEKVYRPAREVLAKIPCEVLYNISDEEALRHAFTENHERRDLTIREEVALVERLSRRGMRQDEIADLLGTNVTWVSQTANFRTELPSGAFAKLLDGSISRHVAVQMLSFNSEDRAALFEAAVKVEATERTRQLQELTEAVEQAEDQEDIEEQRELTAQTTQAANRARKRRAAAVRKGQTAKNRIEKVRSEAGTIRQGHLAKAAIEAGVAPRKAKILTKQMIEQFYVQLLDKWLERGRVDHVTKREYPLDMIRVIQGTAQAILSGQADPGLIIRSILVDRGEWTLPTGYVEEPVELLDIAEGDEEIEDVEEEVVEEEV